MEIFFYLKKCLNRQYVQPKLKSQLYRTPPRIFQFSDSVQAYVCTSENQVCSQKGHKKDPFLVLLKTKFAHCSNMSVQRSWGVYKQIRPQSPSQATACYVFTVLHTKRTKYRIVYLFSKTNKKYITKSKAYFGNIKNG